MREGTVLETGCARATDPDKTVVKLSELRGRPVQDVNARRLGFVADVILEPGTSRITHAVLSCGDLLGDSEAPLVAIPWQTLIDRGGAEPLSLGLDRERFREMVGRLTSPAASPASSDAPSRTGTSPASASTWGVGPR